MLYLMLRVHYSTLHVIKDYNYDGKRTLCGINIDKMKNYEVTDLRRDEFNEEGILCKRCQNKI